VRAAMHLAGEANMSTKSYRAEEARLAGESGSRPVQFLTPRDAAHLYRSLHARRTLVFAFAVVLVRRDPSRVPAVTRATVRLETFVAHKSLYRLPMDLAEAEASFASFIAARGSIGCRGENDPRALPLHVFETNEDWSALGVTAVDKEFVRLYGKPGQRTDGGKKEWKRPSSGGYHGRQVLTVAGRVLAQGMHWDVGPGSQRKATIYGPDQVWKLTRRDGHANIYPDAHVRAGHACKRVWKPSG